MLKTVKSKLFEEVPLFAVSVTFLSCDASRCTVPSLSITEGSELTHVKSEGSTSFFVTAVAGSLSAVILSAVRTVKSVANAQGTKAISIKAATKIAMIFFIKIAPFFIILIFY